MQVGGQQIAHQISLYALNACKGQTVTGAFAVFLCVEIHPLQYHLKESWLTIFRRVWHVTSSHRHPPWGTSKEQPFLKDLEALLCTGSHLRVKVLTVPQDSGKGLTKSVSTVSSNILGKERKM